jgi:HD-like signal output (HDOD) protein
MQPTSLSQIIQDTHTLPSIPGIASRLLERLQDPETNANEISTLIEMDPALSLKVLQLANSAMFAPASPVHSIERALVLLGFNTVRFLITGVAVLQVAQQMPQNEIINPEIFWRSAFRGAVAAKFLATKSGYHEPNEAYLAGLIRKIGQIALIQCAYETYLPIVQAARAEGVATIHKEKELLGFTHADVGALLAVKWNLDEGLAGVIAAYPFPSDHPQLENLHLAAILHLADQIVQIETAHSGIFVQTLAQLDPLALQSLSETALPSLTSEILADYWQELEPLLEQENPFV